jgi:hypothetical protein
VKKLNLLRNTVLEYRYVRALYISVDRTFIVRFIGQVLYAQKACWNFRRLAWYAKVFTKLHSCSLIKVVTKLWNSTNFQGQIYLPNENRFLFILFKKVFSCKMKAFFQLFVFFFLPIRLIISFQILFLFFSINILCCLCWTMNKFKSILN